MSDLIPNHDSLLNDPYFRQTEAEDEEEEVELDGLEEDIQIEDWEE